MIRVTSPRGGDVRATFPGHGRPQAETRIGSKEFESTSRDGGRPVTGVMAHTVAAAGCDSGGDVSPRISPLPTYAMTLSRPSAPR